MHPVRADVSVCERDFPALAGLITAQVRYPVSAVGASRLSGRRRVPPSSGRGLSRLLSSVNAVPEERCGSAFGANGKKVAGIAVVRTAGIARTAHSRSFQGIARQSRRSRPVGGRCIQCSGSEAPLGPAERGASGRADARTGSQIPPGPRSRLCAGDTWGVESPFGSTRQPSCRCTVTAARPQAEVDGVRAGRGFLGGGSLGRTHGPPHPIALSSKGGRSVSRSCLEKPSRRRPIFPAKSRLNDSGVTDVPPEPLSSMWRAANVPGGRSVGAGLERRA